MNSMHENSRRLPGRKSQLLREMGQMAQPSLGLSSYSGNWKTFWSAWVHVSSEREAWEGLQDHVAFKKIMILAVVLITFTGTGEYFFWQQAAGCLTKTTVLYRKPH